MKQVKYRLLFYSFLLVFAAGFVGSFFTAGAIKTWYVSLARPSFAPPNWIFGPVWTSLYVLMAISLYLVWVSRAKEKLRAVRLFAIHLIVNALWSFVFFGMRDIGLAFVVILVLLFLIAILIFKFNKINKLSAYLLLPYFLWVLFASYLNYWFNLLN